MGNGDALDGMTSFGRPALRGYFFVERGEEVVDPLVSLFPPVTSRARWNGSATHMSVED
jgi:hypothetical protein